jgi:TP901 family phage tail tape measure protein
VADRSISIALEARVQGFVSGMKTAQKATSDFADRTAAFARDNEQNLDRVGKASMVMGGALLAGVGLAVKSFMDFDSAMSSVQASTHATAGDMDLLREAAINAGADTAFSATEAANAIDEMSKAGVDTADILNGGLTGALNLAAAGSLGVADAAEIAATSLTQFKLSGEDLPHVADLLAAGAGKAQGSVQDLGLALSYAGVPAKGLGMSIEDTTGALALFASNGIIGEKAGTALRGMLVSMTKPAKETQKAMDDLGISFFDTKGEFIGLSEVSGVLKDKLGGVDSQTRNAALAQIFGNEALGAAQSLYDAGPDKVDAWTEAVNESGYAAVTASMKSDNLAGDIEKLGGSFDSVLIKSGSGAAESLRGLVQGAEDLVDAIGDIPTPILNAGVGIAGIAGGALLLTGAVASGLPKFIEFRDSLADLAEKSPRAAAGIGKVAKAAGIAAAAMIALQIAGAIFTEKQTKSAEDYGQALLKVGKAAQSIDGSGLDTAFQGWDKLAFGDTVADVDSMSDAIRRLSSQNFGDWLNTNMADPVNRLLGFAESDITQITARLEGLGEEMGNLAKNGAGETAAKSFQALTKEFEKNGKGAKEALAALPGYRDALQGLATTAGVVLTEQDLLDFAMGKVPASMSAAATATETFTTKAGNAAPLTEEMAKALENVGLAADGSITSIDAFAKSLFAAGLLNLSASDAAIAYQDAIDKVTESVKTNGTTLDINTEQGRANQSAFNGLAQSAMTAMEATASQTLATEGSAAAQAQLQGALHTSYDDLVAAAGQFGITGDEADTMARKALGIPKNVNIDAWIADHASTTLDGIKGKAEGLDGKRVTIGIYTTEYFDSVDRRSAASDLNGAASGTGRPGLATGGRVFGVVRGFAS